MPTRVTGQYYQDGTLHQMDENLYTNSEGLGRTLSPSHSTIFFRNTNRGVEWKKTERGGERISVHVDNKPKLPEFGEYYTTEIGEHSVRARVAGYGDITATWTRPSGYRER